MSERRSRVLAYRLDLCLGELQEWTEQYFEKDFQKQIDEKQGITDKVKTKLKRKMLEAKVKGLRAMITPFRELVKETVEKTDPKETEKKLVTIIARLKYVLDLGEQNGDPKE